MNDLFNKLAYSLFNKNSVDECSVEELKDMADKYPYFSSAQILYLKKLAQEDHPSRNDQFEKTSLTTHNPLWLNLILEEDQKASLDPVQEPANPEPYDTVIEDFRNDELVVENRRTVFEKSESTAAEEIKIQQPDQSEPVNDELLFDPYHTVDYFASQGIKPDTEEKPNDQFGQQLRSFTEWLKTLRQMPGSLPADQEKEVSDENVVRMADQSVKDNAVLTEAMAEVWIKQGQWEKAREVYDKLSLLNPSKSSYFASLKDKIKNN